MISALTALLAHHARRVLAIVAPAASQEHLSPACSFMVLQATDLGSFE
jgi:hypothetical protein